MKIAKCDKGEEAGKRERERERAIVTEVRKADRRLSHSHMSDDVRAEQVWYEDDDDE
jgi:hypothetical protein